MGNRISLTRRSFGLESNSFAFWMGNMPISSPRLPMCWDELADWSDDASDVFQVFLRVRKTESEVDVLADEIQFIPYVLKEKCEDVYSLSSMEWLERTQFYAENVSLASTGAINYFLLYSPSPDTFAI